MKKYTVLCAGLCAVMAFTGCKTSESAYKKAYMKAKAKEEQNSYGYQQPQQQAQQPAMVVTPMEEKSAADTRVVDNADNVKVKQERVSLVNGSGLRNFSVVVGSFSVPANAEGLQRQLKDAGYDAQIVKNDALQPVMYRVVATTFDSKMDAAASRDQLQGKYPGAWLLYNMR